jgi:dynein intermediate chain
LLRTFDFEDYVYDISWSPIHPALFAACDGSGKLTIMNILTNERMTHGLAATANKIVWDKEGKFVACGSSNGTLYIYNAGEIITPEHDDLIAMQQLH